MEVLEGAVVQVEGRCVSSVTVHRVECVEIEQNLMSLRVMKVLFVFSVSVVSFDCDPYIVEELQDVIVRIFRTFKKFCVMRLPLASPHAQNIVCQLFSARFIHF